MSAHDVHNLSSAKLCPLNYPKGVNSVRIIGISVFVVFRTPCVPKFYLLNADYIPRQTHINAIFANNLKTLPPAMRNQLYRQILPGLIALSFWSHASAHRSEATINDGWEFRMPDATYWESVNIPHTYNLDAYEGRNYYQGKGLYRRHLNIKDHKPGQKHYLKFDAASKAADVAVNGRHIASHKGGYSAFVVDISDYITDGDNLIEVTVDNKRPEITPISADFTFWGGIYRDVWLISTPAIHFNMANYGSDGIFITTPEVSEKSGKIRVISEVANESAKDETIEVKSLIYSPSGELIQTLTEKRKLKPGETRSFTSESKSIDSPQLWSPESPALYTVKTVLTNSRTKEVLDRRSHKTAFRWFKFDGNKGFSLNGKPYKLRGVNRHQDQWPVGVALDDEAHRRDIRLMKDIGCNFIRIAHYPQDDALLDACDELGLLAWEEIPIVNIVPDTPEYDDNCETNLVEMIRQHYNHPSIIAWGYMNEILLTAPGPDRPEWPACKERTVRLARRLEARLKEEDPSRNSVMAFNMTNLYNEIGLDLEDVAGWNLYHGWYVGQLNGFNEWCEDQHRRYPDHPIIISEWGAGSDRRIHSNSPRAFDFSIEYQQRYIEHYLPYIEEKEWISGCAYWNFIDFNVAARQESMPRVNNKGLFYNDRSPKDVAYYFKAMWRKDKPVIRIASRDWDVRVGDRDVPQTIKLYSNAPEVELFINGVSAGIQKTSNCHALYSIVLPEGESVLTARTRAAQDSASDAMTITFMPTPDMSEDEFAINAGCNCYFTSDLSGLTWLPDQPYEPGGWGFTGGKDRNTTSEIHGTIDGPIYQTWRQGAVSYRIDVKPGDYEVELLMADITRPARQQANLLGKSDGEKTTASTRFDINVCGETVEHDFSPADGKRYRTACRKRYIVNDVTDGITVDLIPIEGEPTLAGIKIRRI